MENKGVFILSAATKDEPDADSECRSVQQNGGGNRGKLAFNGYSEEWLDRLEPNGNIPHHDKDDHFGKLLFVLPT